MGRRDIFRLLRKVLRNQIISVDQRMAHLVRAVGVSVANLDSVACGRLEVVLETFAIGHVDEIVGFSRAL